MRRPGPPRSDEVACLDTLHILGPGHPRIIVEAIQVGARCNLETWTCARCGQVPRTRSIFFLYGNFLDWKMKSIQSIRRLV
jgi:hypothetical protein